MKAMPASRLRQQCLCRVLALLRHHSATAAATAAAATFVHHICQWLAAWLRQPHHAQPTPCEQVCVCMDSSPCTAACQLKHATSRAFGGTHADVRIHHIQALMKSYVSTT